MKFFKIIIAFIVSLGIFALVNKVMTTMGKITLEKSTIDLTTEFGHNMVAINALVAFVVSIFLAVKVFKIIKGNEPFNS